MPELDIENAVYGIVAQRRGSISAEHGIGSLKIPFLHFSRSEAEIALMRAIKKAMDPNGIMNPGQAVRRHAGRTLKPKAISLQLIRQLDLAAGSEPDRPAWLSAASGLVRTADEYCVVADDELHLGRFSLDGQRPGRLLRIFPGDLPDKPKPRKKRKPDLEVLLRLPASADFPHGALLALGSGSGERRRRGALLALGMQGRVVGKPRSIDASQLFTRLSQSFTDLNLEGGWVAGDRLHLLQRGNKGDSPNALLQWELKPVLRSLLRDRCLPDVEPCRCARVRSRRCAGRAAVLHRCFATAGGRLAVQRRGREHRQLAG